MGLVAGVEIEALQDVYGVAVPGFVSLRSGLNQEVGLLATEGAFGEPGVANHLSFRAQRLKSTCALFGRPVLVRRRRLAFRRP